MITSADLERWKRESIKTAIESGLDRDVLEYIDKSVGLEILPGHSYPHRFYGITRISVGIDGVADPFRILVNEINPSFRLPENLREIYNQSGMDHEFIGHAYNSTAGLPYNERAAVKRQKEFAYHRAKKDSSWKAARFFIPAMAMLIGTVIVNQINKQDMIYLVHI